MREDGDAQAAGAGNDPELQARTCSDGSDLCEVREEATPPASGLKWCPDCGDLQDAE